MVRRLAPHLLRRHIARRPHHLPRLSVHLHRRRVRVRIRLRLRSRQFRQTKIQNLHPLVVGDEQIFRLQVAMNDSLFVRCRQSPRHLQPILNRLAAR